MTRIIVCLVGCFYLSNVWAQPPQPIEMLRLTPVDKRITDEAIAADMQAFKDTQARIVTLNAEGLSLNNYYLAKAQAWLELAEEEYTENDRGAVVEVALGQALYLIEQLEARATNISMETPALDPQTRPDLWQKVETLKARGANCVDATTAQLEVQLVRVDHEQQELGFVHAKPYIMAAERLVEQVSESSHPACRPSSGSMLPQIAAQPVEQAPSESTDRASVAATSSETAPRAALSPDLPQNEADITAVRTDVSQVPDPPGRSDSGTPIPVEEIIPLARVAEVPIRTEAVAPTTPTQTSTVHIEEPVPQIAIPTDSMPVEAHVLPSAASDQSSIEKSPAMESFEASLPDVVEEILGTGLAIVAEENSAASSTTRESTSSNPPTAQAGTVPSSAIISATTEAMSQEADMIRNQVNHEMPASMATPAPASILRLQQAEDSTARYAGVPEPQVSISIPDFAMPPSPFEESMVRKDELSGSEAAVAIPRVIHFATNRADIDTIAAILLRQLTVFLYDHPHVRLVLKGHTDERGSDAYNMLLSKRRADAARAFLIQDGVAPDRITVSFYGKRFLLAPQHTEQDYARNRRVEIQVIGQVDVTFRDDDVQPEPYRGMRDRLDTHLLQKGARCAQ